MIQIIPKQQFICDSYQLYGHWRTIVNHLHPNTKPTEKADAVQKQCMTFSNAALGISACSNPQLSHIEIRVISCLLTWMLTCNRAYKGTVLIPNCILKADAIKKLFWLWNWWKMSNITVKNSFPTPLQSHSFI